MNSLALDGTNLQDQDVHQRGVRIFAEWLTSPLWTAGGVSLDEITAELRTEFDRWNDEWMLLADEVEDDDWDTDSRVIAWNGNGYELARRLRAELGPSVEIEYFDYVSGENVNI